MQEQLDGAVPLVTVGFSPPEALRVLADYLGLRGLVLSDPDRVLYRLAGLRRAPLWQVYSSRTLAYYARAMLRGQTLHRPVEDTRQLGGDALVVEGVVTRRWRPSTPEDRVAPGVVAAAALSIQPAPYPQGGPLFRPKAYAQESLFEPEKVLREARRQHDVAVGDMPAVVLLDPDGDLLRHLQDAGEARLLGNWGCYHSQMWTTVIAGTPVGVVPYVVGGPFAVLVAEQAFASGCTLLISMTSAGRVPAVGHVPPYFVIVERAWRDEGTSVHYLPPSPWAGADASILAELAGLPDSAGGQAVLRGSSWTTDAPYRETPDALAQAQAAGILAVEMEAASLYAFAAARGRRVLCIAHVSNDILATTTADFEKGDQGGATAALALLTHVVSALTSGGTTPEDGSTTTGGPS